MDTVLCLDTSSSMSGSGIRELKRAVDVYVDSAQKSGLGERIAIVEFGNNTDVLTHLSNNYQQIKSAASHLATGGTTPMGEGLMHAFKEVAENGRTTVIGNAVRLNPRVILMSDGQPDSADKVKKVATLFAGLGVPIACVGVAGCDKNLLQSIAATTHGLFTMADNVDQLSTFFLKQVLLSIFIFQFAHDLKKLYSIEALRTFMEAKTGRRLNDAELKALLVLIGAITSVKPIKTRRRPSTHPPKLSPKRKTGKAQFFTCFFLSAILSPLVLQWQTQTQPLERLSEANMTGSILGLAVLTYLASRFAFYLTGLIWKLPLLETSQYMGAFTLSCIGFFAMFLSFFSGVAWPTGLGYAALGAIGLMKKYRGQVW